MATESNKTRSVSPSTSAIERILSAAVQYSHCTLADGLLQLCATICDIFDSDGCVISHIPQEPSACPRIMHIYKRAGSCPADRLHRLLLRRTNMENPVLLLNSEVDGMPAITARAALGEMLIYRHNALRHFGKDDAELMGALWRNCGNSGAPGEFGFSPRIRQVLNCLLAGFAEKQIAAELSISHHTVHIYVKRLYRQLGVRSRSQLMIRCLKPDAASLQPAYSIAERPHGFAGDSNVKLKSRIIKPSNEIIASAYPVPAIDSANSNMLFRHPQSAGQ